MTKAQTASTAFATLLKNWPVKLAGPKPTEANLSAALALGYKPGSKAGMAMAMYLRSGAHVGATNGEVVAVVGNPQLNAARERCNAKLVKRVTPELKRGNLQVYAYAMASKPARSVSAKRKAAKPTTAKVAKPEAKPTAPVTDAAPSTPATE